MDIKDLINVGAIKSEEHNMLFEPCQVYEVDAKRKLITVEVNNREGFYEEVIVCGNYFPKKGNVGLLILIGKYKYPFFIPKFFDGIYTPGSYVIQTGDVGRVENPDRKYAPLTQKAIDSLRNGNQINKETGEYPDGSIWSSNGTPIGRVKVEDIINLYNTLCEQANIDANLMVAQSYYESGGFQGLIVTGGEVVGKLSQARYKKATGWAQFIASTWVSWSSKPIEYRCDILEAINAQIKYMVYNYGLSKGDTRGAIYSYANGSPTSRNQNPGYVDRVLRIYNQYIK